MGKDYGFLFQEGDSIRRKTDAIDYQYFEENPERYDEIAEAEELFARKLCRILPRLEILGFTLQTARTEYQSIIEEAGEASEYIGAGHSRRDYLTFEEFCDLACRYPLEDLKNDYIEHDTPSREKTAQGRLAADADALERIPWNDNSGDYWSEASYLSARVCILSAESMLQVFAQNAANAEVEVTWEFGPIVHAGCAEREAFQPGARQEQKILIATEGASDARIIRRTLNVLRPDVADFFNFVDVDERHHFWGTGNLIKFAEGLLRIEVLNQILFVFDNDAEGVDAFRKLEKLKLPSNMRAMLLPDLEEFEAFATRGPEGIGISNINGRAAAVECYLDLRLDQYSPPRSRGATSKRISTNGMECWTLKNPIQKTSTISPMSYFEMAATTSQSSQN
jgi:hypothetical protein